MPVSAGTRLGPYEVVAALGADELKIKRASFECDVRPLERNGDEWTAERERYLARFPGSRITFRLSDFTLYRLEFRQGLWVGGFGRAVEITASDIKKLASHGLA